MALYAEQQPLNYKILQEKDMKSQIRYLTEEAGCRRGPEKSKYTCLKLNIEIFRNLKVCCAMLSYELSWNSLKKNAEEKIFPLYVIFMHSRDTSCLKSVNSSHFQEHYYMR